MNKVFFSAVILLFAHAVPTHAEPLSPADIKALLAKIRERRAAAPYVQADFREEKAIHLMVRPIVSSGKVWFQPPDKFRREVKGNSPSVTVNDGHQLWIYYPNFKSAEHYTLGKRSPLDSAIATINTALNLENVEGTFQITGSKMSSGYELRLLPRTPSMKRIFQTFDLVLNDELFVTRTVMSQPNGYRIVPAGATPMRAPIPPETFEFTPPPGTNVSMPLGR
jgi:outer membrane lipoprotein carrier protein